MLKRWDGTGFTLIELIIATAISAVVIGILSVCFAFALRVWGAVLSEKPDPAFELADLLQRQLAECDPTPVKFTEGLRTVFKGQANSIAFVTAHSVKAISQGVPVVVRYTYDAKSRVLYYSEIILDPYHPAAIQEFLANRPSGMDEAKIRSYGVDFQQFALAYAGKDARQFADSWETNDEVPVEVLVSWRGRDPAGHARRIMVNAPFPIEVQKGQASGAQGVVTGQ
jgi:prepilin-type N-terminal cleavage/methylation domain-containing protein